MGHAFDMIAKYVNNRRLVKRRSYYRTMQAYMKATGGRKVSFRKATEEELKVIRTKVKKQRMRENLMPLFALVVALIISAMLLVLFYKYLNKR